MKKIFAMVAVVLMAASSMAANYYLVGWYKNADYKGTDYPVVIDEPVEYTFESEIYVFVHSDEGKDYLTSKYVAYNAAGTNADLVEAGPEKMQIPGGVAVTFTLTEKEGKLNLAYEPKTSGETVYYIKSKWAVDAPDWEWKEMTPNGDKSEWTYTSDFYGSGCNVSTIAIGDGTWFSNEEGKIAGDKIAVGDNVTFTYNVAAKTLTAKNNTATAVENVAVEAKAIKVVENGQIVIIRDGVRYNAVGTAL